MNRKHWTARRAALALAAVGLVAALGASPLRAEESVEEVPSRGVREISDATLDLLVLRPAGLFVLGAGCGAFVPVAILTSPGGLPRLQEALEIFVNEPAAYVFKRPLGKF